jgi:hypothetical protein
LRVLDARFPLLACLLTTGALAQGDPNTGHDKPAASGAAERVTKTCAGSSCPFRLADFKLVAVVMGDAKPVVMVQAPGGVGYVLRLGDPLGREDAAVTFVDQKGVHLQVASRGKEPREFVLPANK